MEHFYATLPGSFNFKSLYDQVLAEACDGAVFAEIGTGYGRSAAYMAVEIANRGKKIDFYCIDTWRGPDGVPAAAEDATDTGSAFPFFRQSTERGGAWPLIRAIELPPIEAAQQFRDQSFDFVMIDGAQDFESVRATVRAWLPKVKPGGLLSGDDADRPEVLLGVQETIPHSELVITNGITHWSYRKRRPSRGEWTLGGQNKTSSDIFAYIPYVNRPELLRRAVESIAELWPSLVIIDQSPGGIAVEEFEFLNKIAGVFRASRSQMSFTQMMNWAQAEAYERNANFVVFMHNDAECQRGVAEEVIEFARENPRAGVVFTNYDAFSVFRTEALRSVGPWDETFRWYHSDVDYYRRLRLAGWESLNFGGSKVTHLTSQTLHSDLEIRREVGAQSRWHAAHYQHKWGGPEGHERFTIPYNGRP